MRVIFVSAEIIPFASTGGLGDVSASLPNALAACGVEVARVMPLYGKIDRERFGLKLCDFRIHVPLGSVWHSGDVWEQTFDGVKTYFLHSNEFFDRPELYGAGGEGYEDNFERFLFFQKGVIRLIDKLDLGIDLVHCNDWQTGLMPMFLHYGVDGCGREMREKTLYTVHNLAYQGWAPVEKFHLTCLPWECYTMHTLEYYGEINCMKGGLVSSNAINTVSPSYAKEITSVELGCGLHDVLQLRSKDLHGILNGIDYSRWNPEIDPHIVRNFSIQELDGKAVCKRFLQEQAGFEVNAAIPLLGLITRLAPQKGIDLLLESMSELVGRAVQILILGSGDTPYEEKLRGWAEQYPDKVCAWIEFSSAKAHQIEAGLDLFLMPSIFEPCGQNQLFSMRYATLPLVHGVGGLADTVVDAQESGGCGFVFHDFTSASFVACIDRAVDLFKQAGTWRQLMVRAMQCDNSGRKMAGNYLELYQKILDEDQRKIVDGRIIQG